MAKSNKGGTPIKSTQSLGNVLDGFDDDDVTIISATDDGNGSGEPPKFNRPSGSASFENFGAPSGNTHSDEDDDEDGEEEEEDDDDDPAPGAGTGTGVGTGAGAFDDEEEEEEEEEDDDSPDGKSKGGRPKALTKAIQTLVDNKILEPFDDGTPINEYSVEDFVELVEVNMERLIGKEKVEAPLKVLSVLPDEVKKVVAYSLNGGTDWKTVMQAAISVGTTLELDPQKEEDQITICRQFLNLTNDLTPEEVEEEINDLKDRNLLAKKAEIYKPKLDAKQAERMTQQLEAQNQARKREEEAALNYKKDVYQVLNNDTLNGLPLTERLKGELFLGLTEKRYTNSKGKPTNELGYLLEQKQFGEKADKPLITEVLWLLRDPKGYKDALLKIAEAEASASQQRHLRSAQRDNAASGKGGHATSSGSGVPRKGKGGNPFKRNK